MSNIKCKNCYKIFSNNQALRRHYGRKFPCKKFVSKKDTIEITTNLSKSIKNLPSKNQPIYHPKTNQNDVFSEITFLCDFCKPIFKHKNNLYTHKTHLRCNKMPKIEMRRRGIKLKSKGEEKLNEITINKIKSLKI